MPLLLPEVPADRNASPELFQRITRFLAAARDGLTALYAGPTWTAVPAFLNGWSNIGSGNAPAAYYRNPNGLVWMRGQLTGGAVNNAAFILPLGLRPEFTLSIAVAASTGTAADASRIGIFADGTVMPLNGINTFFSLECSFWSKP